MLTTILAVHLALAAAAERPDFSGCWTLDAQETSAPRKFAHVGNYEGALFIVQGPDSLLVTRDDGTVFAYLLGEPGEGAGGRKAAGAPEAVAARWAGADLVAKGHRRYSTREGERRFAFEETRRLNPGGDTMTVRTVLDFGPFRGELRRTSVYRRCALAPSR